MCITFVHIDHDPDARYKLILVNNRDEMLDRSTSKANWENGILAGRDEKEKKVRGTWLGMSTDGRISNLLSIIVPIYQLKKNAPSRGSIPYQFIKSTLEPKEFCESMVQSAAQYNPFQVLCLQRNDNDQYEMHGMCNYPSEQMELIGFPPGIYGFGNSPVCRPFKKVQYGLLQMQAIMQETRDLDLNVDKLTSELIHLATDRTQCFPDEQLRQQSGRSNELCRYRSAIYVQNPNGIRYGTRSHTVVIVDRDNQATFYEKRMETAPITIDDALWMEQKFQFDLNG